MKICVTLSLLAWAASALAVQVGYWSFDEGTGNVAGDSSGYGHLGTLVNGTNAWTTGRAGSALYFNGTTGGGSTRVEISDTTLLRLTTAGSFAAWVWNEDIGRDAPIIAKEGGGILSYWFGTFGPSGAGHWGSLLSSSGGTWQFNGRDRGNAPGGEWVHLAASWDGNTVNYYLNGNFEGSLNWSGSLYQSPARLMIGANSEFNNTAFKGKIDEVHLYNHAISAADARALAGVPEPASVLVILGGLGALALRRRR